MKMKCLSIKCVRWVDSIKNDCVRKCVIRYTVIERADKCVLKWLDIKRE